MQARLTLVAFLVLVALVAASGALFPPGEWYAGLEKPPWTPPDAVFGPVWTLLYILVAMAGARAWQGIAPAQRRGPFIAYFLQLGLNAGWSALFFGLQFPALALLELLLLAAAIVVTMRLFAAHDRIAAWLLLPYLAWVLFAGLLNAAIAWLN